MAQKPSSIKQIKETIISVVIAFAMAFVARAFVIEPFVIPTGSMAPTLMGAHIRINSPETGANWPLDPPARISAPGAPPAPIQGQPGAPIFIHDPMTSQELQRHSLATKAGDRILVYKYLFGIYDPQRWDVSVFKAPHEPAINYIKRLVGLPGEQLAIVDGDVFARTPVAGENLPPNASAWSLPGWQIQRKPERAQRTAWQPVFSSEYAPLNPIRDHRNQSFRSPWTAGDQGWNITPTARSYTYTGSTPTTLAWDSSVKPINDYYSYNEGIGQNALFPVSDIAISAGVEPAADNLSIAAVFRTRRHELRAEVVGTAITLRMGPLEGTRENPKPPTRWTVLDHGTLPRALTKGKVANVEFWHVDQSLQVWLDGVRVVEAAYDWSPAERIAWTTGLSVDDIIDRDRVNNRLSGNSLGNADLYSRPQVAWEISGPVTLHRVRLLRDLYYQPRGGQNPAQPPRATHPLNPITLTKDQFFLCGDNSPASLDGRLWPAPDPWAAVIDPTEGVVHRDLMTGRAFFVYFPAFVQGPRSPTAMPDTGRLRWIW
jgi:signal peptidase I